LLVPMAFPVAVHLLLTLSTQVQYLTYLAMLSLPAVFTHSVPQCYTTSSAPAPTSSGLRGGGTCLLAPVLFYVPFSNCPSNTLPVPVLLPLKMLADGPCD